MMINLRDKKFGRLKVLGRAGKNKHNQLLWLCQCRCGKTIIVRGYSLRDGNTNSCGCLRNESITKHSHLTGAKKTATYTAWDHMIQRCTNIRNTRYGHYGGRGIVVSKKWMKFENFLKDMGKRPTENHSIDRIDNDKGYYRENCRWATRKQQARNTTRNHKITHNGKTQCIAEWAEEFGIHQSVLYSRIKLGWSMDIALKTGVRSKNDR